MSYTKLTIQTKVITKVDIILNCHRIGYLDNYLYEPNKAILSDVFLGIGKNVGSDAATIERVENYLNFQLTS